LTDKQADWARNGVLVAILFGVLAISITIMTSNWDNTTKYFGVLAIVFVGYATYNELTKPKVK
jgi:hypothetical protein